MNDHAPQRTRQAERSPSPKVRTPMKKLPASQSALFVRTAFDDSEAWDTICTEIRQPPADMMAVFAQFAAINEMLGQDLGDEPKAHLTLVDDPAFADLTPDQLIDRLPAKSPQTFLFIVDRESITRPDHPILVLDVSEEKGRTFRAVPAQIQAIENNLSIANMDFADFADAVDSQGVYRGS